MSDFSEALPQLGEAVWGQTLGWDLVPTGDQGAPAPSATMQGRVLVSGHWQGAVVLQCSPAVARRATASMFNRPEDGLSSDDMCDTVGELTNIFGGAVKSLVSESGCHLSLPVVVEGADYVVHTPQTRVVARQAFTDAGEPVVVTILEAVPKR